MATTSASVSAEYRFDQWLVENGLPHKTVESLLQTRDGYLWLATADGLVRFDGLRFAIFNTGTDVGIRSNRMGQMTEDEDGNVWIATGNQSGVIRYSHGTFVTLTSKDGLLSNAVQDVKTDPKGGVLLLTNKGLVKYQQGRFLTDPRQPQQIHETSRLFFDRQGALWVNCADGLYCFSASGLRHYTEKDGLPSRYVTSLYQDRQGDYWISTRQEESKFTTFAGLCRMRDGNITIFTEKDGLPTQNYWTYCEDKQGNLFLGGGHHIVRYRENRFEYAPEQGFPAYKVWAKSLLCDAEGNVWAGTQEYGLMRLRPKLIATITKEQGLPTNPVYSLLNSPGGSVWMGTWNGLAEWRDGVVYNHQQKAGSQPLLITALGLDRQQQLWIGSYDGTHLFKAGKFERWYEQWPENKIYVVHAFLTDRQGNLWIGAEGGGLGRLTNGVRTYYFESDGLPSNEVKFILEARDGALWIGTNGGLARWQNEKFTAWTERDGLVGNHIRCLYEDATGAIWIGTSDAGLGRFKDGKFTSLTVREGLFDQGVFCLLDDQQGHLWITSNHGIYRVSQRELNEFAEGRIKRIHSLSFTKKDGLLDSECNGGSQPPAVRTPDGRLWFPTQMGVAIIDPAALPPPTITPVAIETCLVDRQRVDYQSGVQLLPAQENLEIHFTGINFSFPEQVRFRYQMVGIDQDWIEAGTQRSVNYSHLPPGNYSFHVTAANPEGEWNPKYARLSIKVIPPFWRRWWFLSLVVLVLGLSISYGVKRRLNALQQARAEQERFSQLLLDSQEQERKRIAAELHDSLNQTLVIIKNRALLSLKTPDNHDRAVGQLEEIAGAATQAIEEVKEIAYALRPYYLDRLGLTKAIAELLDKISEAHGLQIASSLDDIDKLFPPAAEINFYRIVQESLNNIVRHAQASKASVTIRKSPSAVTLAIQDNGRGFTPGAPPTDGTRRTGGFGLIGLQERARMLGGQLTIQSTPGQGTTISMSLPLQRSEA